MSFEEFQDGRHGGHLGYLNGKIFAILNHYVTPMPPIKFRLNLTYGLGDVVWRVAAILDIRMEQFSNSDSLCHCDVSHQVLGQSDLRFGRCHLKNFKMAAISHLGYQSNFSNSESLCHCDASHQVSAQSDFWFGRRCRLKNFKMATMAAILDIGMEWF